MSLGEHCEILSPGIDEFYCDPCQTTADGKVDQKHAMDNCKRHVEDVMTRVIALTSEPAVRMSLSCS